VTSWLEVLLNFLREFVPLRVIREGFHGVRFVRGHATGPFPPNWYWSIPLFYEMESYPTAEQVVNLTNVSCTTEDDCSITLSANFNYLVENAVLAYTWSTTWTRAWRPKPSNTSIGLSGRWTGNGC